MDLIFKRYSSPFIFLEKLIENNKFYEGVQTILDKANDDKLWELYLHSMSEKSFIEWKAGLTYKDDEEPKELNIEVAKMKARNILNHFNPEKEGGV